MDLPNKQNKKCSRLKEIMSFKRPKIEISYQKVNTELLFPFENREFKQFDENDLNQIIFSIKKNSKLLRFEKSQISGWGIRTSSKIFEKEPILELKDEIINEIPNNLKNKSNYAFFNDSNQILDFSKSNSLVKYINHCCRPNCFIKSYNINGRIVNYISSKRDIEPSEEITIDYNLPIDIFENRISCKCGSAICKKWMNFISPSTDEFLTLQGSFIELPLNNENLELKNKIKLTSEEDENNKIKKNIEKIYKKRGRKPKNLINNEIIKPILKSPIKKLSINLMEPSDNEIPLEDIQNFNISYEPPSINLINSFLKTLKK